MQRYLKIQQKARKKQAERELVQSGEHDTPMQPEGQEGQPRTKSLFPTIHFVETAPSVLRELPWILLREYKVRIWSCVIRSECLIKMRTDIFSFTPIAFPDIAPFSVKSLTNAVYSVYKVSLYIFTGGWAEFVIR